MVKLLQACRAQGWYLASDFAWQPLIDPNDLERVEGTGAVELHQEIYFDWGGG